jgi:hypothetical protein
MWQEVFVSLALLVLSPYASFLWYLPSIFISPFFEVNTNGFKVYPQKFRAFFTASLPIVINTKIGIV